MPQAHRRQQASKASPQQHHQRRPAAAHYPHPEPRPGHRPRGAAHLGHVAVVVQRAQVVEQFQRAHQRLRRGRVHEVKVHLRPRYAQPNPNPNCGQLWLLSPARLTRQCSAEASAGTDAGSQKPGGAAHTTSVKSCLPARRLQYEECLVITAAEAQGGHTSQHSAAAWCGRLCAASQAHAPQAGSSWRSYSMGSISVLKPAGVSAQFIWSYHCAMAQPLPQHPPQQAAEAA